MKVLIVPDKFKGTLTAHAAAKAIARGWRRARPADVLRLLPMSDGGDGFGEVTSALLNAKACRTRTVDAAHRPGWGKWWWEPASKTAIVECATVCGLAMLPPKKFHPFALDTFGLGAVLQAARKKGAIHFLIGIGGSATNDGGFGLARALGWKFLDDKGMTIERWPNLDRLKHICPPDSPLPSQTSTKQMRNANREVRVAVDVQNPLLGARGATRVYGPQKGLRPEDFAAAEKGLERLARVVQKTFGQDIARRPGAGAAGGLGFGLAAFFAGCLEPGFDLFAGLAGLDKRMRKSDLVITGEGKIDHSTLMGKGVGEIARRCQELNRRCIGLGGVVDIDTQQGDIFEQAHGLTEMTSTQAAMQKAGYWLEQLTEKVARAIERS